MLEIDDTSDSNWLHSDRVWLPCASALSPLGIPLQTCVTPEPGAPVNNIILIYF